MAVAGVLVTQLNSAAVRTKLLTVGGVDVIKQPGNTTNPYGVPLDSIEVEEAGPGGVSSMRFVINDPAISVIVQDGMDIRFHDITNDVPIFSGWVQSWRYLPAFGQQGRRIEVTAIGGEAVLDWAFVASLTIPAGTDFRAAVQSAVANAEGIRDLRPFANPAITAGPSTQAMPIANLYLGGGDAQGSISSAVVLNGVSLREAIRQIGAVSTYQSWYYGGPAADIYATVDAYKGLRVWRKSSTINDPGDYTTLTIDDTPSGSIRAEGLNHEVDAAGIVRAVYITGGNALGTGLVTDGTGKPGPVASFSDSTILTADALAQAGQNFLAQYAVGSRGSFNLIDHTPTVTVHAGGAVTITDARAGLAAQSFYIMSIRKTFNAVRQTWSISYGGLPPSAMRLTRRLTRAVRA